MSIQFFYYLRFLGILISVCLLTLVVVIVDYELVSSGLHLWASSGAWHTGSILSERCYRYSARPGVQEPGNPFHVRVLRNCHSANLNPQPMHRQACIHNFKDTFSSSGHRLKRSSFLTVPLAIFLSSTLSPWAWPQSTQLSAVVSG